MSRHKLGGKLGLHEHQASPAYWNAQRINIAAGARVLLSSSALSPSALISRTRALVPGLQSCFICCTSTQA